MQQDDKEVTAVLSVEYLESTLEDDVGDESYNYPSSLQISERSSKYYKQTYRRAWEMMPDFKGWLTGIEGQPLRAYCLYCQKSLHAHRLSLLKHTCTIRHQKAAELHRFQKSKLKGGNYMKIRKEVMSDLEGVEEDMTVEPDIEEDEDEEGNDDALEEIEDANYTEEIIPLEDQDTLEVAVEGNPEEIYVEEPKYNHYNRSIGTIKMSSAADSPGVKSIISGTAHNNPSAIDISMTARKTPISTHVLDTSRGQPVGGLQVSLYRLINGRWTYINEGVTNTDGRCSQLLEKGEFLIGRYKLHFDVDKYFEAQKIPSLYPFIEIVFDCKDNAENVNYHIPLLLNPFGYTTYRGS